MTGGFQSSESEGPAFYIPFSVKLDFTLNFYLPSVALKFLDFTIHIPCPATKKYSSGVKLSEILIYFEALLLVLVPGFIQINFLCL